jgi:hypothetical protein
MPKVLILKRFGHEQTIPSTSWNITHNLHLEHPIVDVWIRDGENPLRNSDAHEVSIVDVNNVIIDFSGDAVTGHALVT